MSNPRWHWIVRWADQTGVWSERRFLWEASAVSYASGLTHAGFYSVKVFPRRYKINQRPQCQFTLGQSPQLPSKKVYSLQKNLVGDPVRFALREHGIA